MSLTKDKILEKIQKEEKFFKKIFKKYWHSDNLKPSQYKKLSISMDKCEERINKLKQKLNDKTNRF